MSYHYQAYDTRQVINPSQHQPEAACPPGSARFPYFIRQREARIINLSAPNYEIQSARRDFPCFRQVVFTTRATVKNSSIPCLGLWPPSALPEGSTTESIVTSDPGVKLG